MASESKPSTQPTTQTESLRAWETAMASGDEAKLADLIAATNDEERALRASLAGVCGAVGAFGQALSDVFGKDAQKQWGVQHIQPNVDVVLKLNAGSSRIPFDGVAKLMQTRQVDGLLPADEPLRRMTEMAEAVRKVTAGVKSHHYPNAAAAAQAAKEAFADAARGAQAQ